ncbi:MAG: hypothetical protein HPY57_13085 [Ignavibacteria bacterium]|nr:hypothetical protein [Ignavibacteria bacterium]
MGEELKGISKNELKIYENLFKVIYLTSRSSLSEEEAIMKSSVLVPFTITSLYLSILKENDLDVKKMNNFNRNVIASSLIMHKMIFGFAQKIKNMSKEELEDVLKGRTNLDDWSTNTLQEIYQTVSKQVENGTIELITSSLETYTKELKGLSDVEGALANYIIKMIFETIQETFIEELGSSMSK